MALCKDVRFWATPDCNTSTYSNGKMGPSIREQAANWPTPSAAVMNDGETPETWHARAAMLKEKHGNGNGAGLPLTVAAVRWPTPNAMDCNMTNQPRKDGGQVQLTNAAGAWLPPSSHQAQPTQPGPEAQKRANTKRTTGMPTEAQNWATPQARDHKNPDKPESGNFQRKLQQGYTIDLNSQTAAWPTPRTTDTNQGRGSVLIGSAYYRPSKALSAGELVGQANLADVAQMWPTPMASDDGHKVTINSNLGASHQFMERQFSHQAQATQPGPELLSNGPTSHRRLNPAFTEWLMGWPTGWTIAAPSASSAAGTALWRHRLHLHLSALCAE